MTDLRAQMAAGAAQPSTQGPPKMQFTQPGEEVYGQVTSTRFDFTTENGVAHLMEVNDTARGAVTVWLTAAQLDAGFVQGRNQLNRRVQVGDIVYIRYDGKVSLEHGKTLNQFSINLASPVTTPAPQQVAPPVYQQPVQQQAPVQQMQQPVQQWQPVQQAPVQQQWQAAQQPNGQQIQQQPVQPETQTVPF